MQKNIKIFIVISILGLFFSPVVSYACKTPAKGIEKEMSCCASTKEQPHVKENCKKQCCKSTEKSSNDCSGQCGNNSCLSVLTHFAAINTGFRYDESHLVVECKTSYPVYVQSVYSSGVSSIWQPPKIS